MILYVLLFLSLTQRSASAPADVARDFCAIYLKQHFSGRLLDGDARRALAPFLSTRLLRHLDEARACQADWRRQQPKGSTDKPPFVDSCLFSSMPDGMPSSFTTGATSRLADGRTTVVINFVRKERADTITWGDALIVTHEGGRAVIDDVHYDLNKASDPPHGRLSDAFEGCRGTRWVGMPSAHARGKSRWR